MCSLEDDGTLLHLGHERTGIQYLQLNLFNRQAEEMFI
jgi:hypothetical protein